MQHRDVTARVIRVVCIVCPCVGSESGGVSWVPFAVAIHHPVRALTGLELSGKNSHPWRDS